MDLIIRQAYLRHYQQRFEDEVRLYHEALANNPTDFSFLNNMAWSLCEGLNDPKTALERINEAFRQTAASIPSSSTPAASSTPGSSSIPKQFKT